MRKPYPTDLSDDEWKYIEPHVPRPKGQGRPRTHSLRGEILNATFYVLRSGCQWRMLPHDFPRRWPTVYHYYFRKWRIDGTWERINRAIRERLRVRLKRDPQPSAGIVDSQSVKTTGVGGEERGYDGGKKIDGRKRHLLVDTEGFVLKVKVHSAKEVMDYEGIKKLLQHADEKFPRLEHLWLDAGAIGAKTKARVGWREGLRVERRTRRTSAQTCPGEGARGVGSGVGQGRQKGRLAEAASAARVPSVTSSVGGGTLLGLGVPQPQDEQGLREALCERRSVRVRCDEPPYDKAVGSHLRPFHTVS
jgi:transposase